MSRVRTLTTPPARPETGLRAQPMSSFAALLRQRRSPDPIREDDADDADAELADGEGVPAAAAVKPPEADTGVKPAPDEQVPLAASPEVDAAALRPDDTWLRVAEDLAHTIAGFCNDRAVSGVEGWQVQMDLRADLVADTTLHLALSPHWLTLRFQARDARSHDLLFKGRDELARLLESTIAPRREIAISFDST
jgi:type III secretion control protein HpaP